MSTIFIPMVLKVFCVKSLVFYNYLLQSFRFGFFVLLCLFFVSDRISGGIGALSMLMSEPTAKKLCKEDMYVCPLNREIYIYIYSLILDYKARSQFISSCCSLYVWRIP